jgi:hypothetical protein
MNKNSIIILLCALLLSYVSKAQDIVWDFNETMQGWHDLGAGRDVVASWEDGALKMTYIDGAPTQGPQLWFAAVEVDYEFDSKDYPYLELYYRAVNWPTQSPVKFLITFKNANNQLVYAYTDLDPAKNFVSVEIDKYFMTWGQVYTGMMKSVQLELPHNGAAAANPATAWFGASTLIDKVVLTSTPGVPPTEPFQKKKFHWSFDTNFSDSTNTVTGQSTGNPSIQNTNVKKGNGALSLNGSDVLTFPANELFASDKITFTCWVKTPATGQTNPSAPASVLSFGSTNFEVALLQNNLSVRDYRTWKKIAEPWNNNVWQRVAITIDGNILNCYINGIRTATDVQLTTQNRTGNLSLGTNGLKTVLDELTIYNYVMSYEELIADGLTPPKTVHPWTFNEGLEGWREVADGITRDITLAWQNGAMEMRYENKAVNDGPQLWFPQVEVDTEFDAALYPYCDISYQTVGWPVTTPVKALLELKKPDNTIAYAYFDLDPTKNSVRVNIQASDPGWGVKYSGQIVSVKLELPHNASANPASNWFGASTLINEIAFNNNQAAVDDVWNGALGAATFNKTGMTRLNNPKFQYQTIGLGGTTMRVDPWGFGYHTAPNAVRDYNHTPSFGYEYWWDTSGHRYSPFHIKGGYGDQTEPGTITNFEQNLDIRTGILETKLTLNVGGTVFNSVRETFITPDGILVIRVKDNGAPTPVKLNLAINEKVEWFGTYYAGEEDPFVRDAINTTNRNSGAIGGVVATIRQNTSNCAVAVAVESTSTPVVSANSNFYSQTSADGTITFYIAPTSSYNPLTTTVPWDHAWNAASGAKASGYDALKSKTANWWNEFLNVSKVSVPDEKVMKLYTQSLYYHGIYFGNGNIPPGCFGTDIYGFFGAVCPEYDLPFSSYAMAYTGRLNETKNIADWVYAVLPKAKEQAVNGVQHHNVFRKYNEGAIYTTLMGYDGTMTIQGEPFEGQNLWQNYPGINSAKMALNYLDYSDDQSFAAAAHDVLESTTYVALEELVMNARGFYQDGKAPNSMQQGAALAGFQETVKRGIARPEWISKYTNKILMPQGILNGDTLLSGAVGYNPTVGEGTAPYFYPLWWANVINKHDPRAIRAIDNFKGTFQSYCFNNAWSGVHAAKIYRGDHSLMWLKNFERPDVLLDETSFAENADAPGYKYTPEIGAHGAYICNLTQMLMDPDDDAVIDIFPAIPSSWEYKNVSFDKLLAKGALEISAERTMNHMKVTITNNAHSVRNRTMRIKMPRFLKTTDDNITIENGFVVQSVSLQPNESNTFEYSFIPIEQTTFVEELMQDEGELRIYPNPTSTGIFTISSSADIDEVLIYNLKGQLVKQFEHQSGSYSVSDLEAGNYLIHIRQGSHFKLKQLIVK